MTKRKFFVPHFFAFTLATFLTTSVNFTAQAQLEKDSAKKILLAKLENNESATIVLKEANVVFPDLLSGNEEQSIDYVEKFSANRRDYLIRMYNKGKKFFPKASKILKKHHIPDEFKVLLALESAFNGNAVSKAGAVGYWQIMDEVAQEYGIKYVRQLTAQEKKKLEQELKKETEVKVDKNAKKLMERDDRKNFYTSTNTAARYLKDRCRNLDNNWLLIVASYNCGVGNVWEAMKKTGKAHPDFWDIKNYLPSETRSYVMNFIALNVVFKNYDKFAKNTLLFKPVKIKADLFEKNITEELDETSSANYY